jgi:hypothetical protein
MSRSLWIGEWTHTQSCSRSLVSPGEVVSADRCVGISIARGPLILIDVATPLGLAPDDVRRALAVSVGDAVHRDQTLASLRRRYRRRSVRAPDAGLVQGIVGGYLLLRLPDVETQILAGVAGTVSDVTAEGQVKVKCNGTRIHGAWGDGGTGRGPLALTTEGADGELTWQKVSRHLTGCVLVGGWLGEERAILRARQFGIAGLLVGGIAAPLARHTGWGLPIVATEGVGVPHMAPTFYRAIQQRAGCVVQLQGGCAEGGPMASISHAVSQGAENSALAVGAGVRLTRGPYLGYEGRISALPEGLQRTALGGLTEGAQIALPAGQRLFAPWENLEVLP